MGAGRLIFLALAPGLAAVLGAVPAYACAFQPITCIGSDRQCHPTEAQRRARERHWSFVATRQAAAEARARLEEGGVDVSAELAELLVPNVRPIRTQMSDCGPIGEVDNGAGRETPESLFREVTAGTRWEGGDASSYASIFRARELSFGTPCNAEFRRSFAAMLNRSVAPTDLHRAWLFLAARQRTQPSGFLSYWRMTRFEGDARVPPIQWQLGDEWLEAQVARFVRRDRAGRALADAMDRFWRERAPTLSDDSQVCPITRTEWEQSKRRVIEEMAARDARRRRAAGISSAAVPPR